MELYSLKPLTGAIKPQSNGPLCSNTVIGTLAADVWAVTLVQQGGAWVGSPPRCTKCNNPPINGNCTNFILFSGTIITCAH